MRRRAVAAGLVVLVAVVVFVMSAPHGLGVDPDSVSYLDAAEDLAEGRAPEDFEGEPLVQWPPLYPAVLAAVMTAGRVGPDTAARVVAALLTGGLAAAVFLAACRFVAGRAARVTAAALALVGAPTVLIVRMALSELLFSVLCFLALWATADAATSGRRRPLVAAGALAGTAVVTRYAGVVLVATCALSLIAGTRAARRERLGRAATFAASSLAPLGAWIAYNAWVRDTSTLGQPTSDGASSWGNIGAGLETIGRWLLPFGDPGELIGVAGVLLLGAAAAAAVSHDRRLVPFALFAVGYPVVIVVLAFFEVARLDIDDPRFLAPAWPAAALVVAAALDRLRPVRVVTVAVAAWVLLLGVAAARDGADLHDRGNGYGAEEWQGSDLVQAVMELPTGATIASNEPFALSHLAEREVRGLSTSSRQGRDRPRPTALAWFDDPHRFDEEVRERPEIEQVEAETGLDLDPTEAAEDGVLYAVEN